MAHIANKIDAKDKKLSEVLYGQRYRVDSFQREYRWEYKHLEALISDLSISFLNNYQTGHTIEDSSKYDCYYMGPVVLCDDNSDLSIIDGQQRLTSFTLLLIFLHHQQDTLQIKEGGIELRNLTDHLYVRKGGKKTLILNVESRKAAIEHLLDNPNKLFERHNEDEGVAEDDSVKNIISRYEDLDALFPKELLDPSILPIFVEWLLEKVILIEVKAYSMENAYTIFETMNDRGLTLSPAEILKGFLLSKINDEEKAEEANEFWKSRISKINSSMRPDSDLDLIRAWLRAKYAVTSREKKIGAENEDFELIATQFNSWVKNNTRKVHLRESKDYYFFIVSDFDFFSDLYINIYNYRSQPNIGYETLYITHFYPIADSLYYPLIISPISKIDPYEIIREKILMVNKFIDIYTNIRSISGKSITQSSIRSYIYEIIKEIRNVDLDSLKNIFRIKIDELFTKEGGLQFLQPMNNWGYYHYFFARILYNLTNDSNDVNFQTLLRSKKQSSLVLQRIFSEDDFQNEDYLLYLNSISNYCLIKRHDIDEFDSKKSFHTKLKFLSRKGYLKDLPNNDFSSFSQPIEFIELRDEYLKKHFQALWIE